MLRIISFIAALVFATSTHAEDWKLSRYDRPLPKTSYEIPKNGLPDGGIAVGGENSTVSEAWYSSPTKRYRHAILGDAIEGGALTVVTQDGATLEFALPQHQAFEDRTPRLIDLDGFGETEVVTILSDTSQGASIAVFGVVDGKLSLIAQTPFIGRSNRWRNIAGIADFDGDGSLQIAEVVTPHIGGTLNFWTWKKKQLVLSGFAYGFSNHRIGSREQDLSVAEDFDGDGVTDLALPNNSRGKLSVMKFTGPANGAKELIELTSITLPSRIERATKMTDVTGKPAVGLELRDGSVWIAHP